MQAARGLPAEAPQEGERAREAQKMLQYGFLNFTNITIAKKNQQIISANVQLGDSETVGLVCKNELSFTVPVEQKGQIRASIHYNETLVAPIMAGTKVGTIEVSIPNKDKLTYDLYPANDVLEASMFQKIYSKSKNWMQSLFSSADKDSNQVTKELILVS